MKLTLSRYTKTPKRDIFGHVKSISPVVYYTIALQHVVYYLITISWSRLHVVFPQSKTLGMKHGNIILMHVGLPFKLTEHTYRYIGARVTHILEQKKQTI